MKKLYEVEVSRHFEETYFIYAESEYDAEQYAKELANDEIDDGFEIDCYNVNSLEEFCNSTGCNECIDIFDAEIRYLADLSAKEIFELIEEQEKLEKEKEYAKIHQINLF